MISEQEFSKQIPAKELILIYKDWFEQHQAAHYIIKGLEFVKINDVSITESSIIYSMAVLNDAEKEDIKNILKNDRIQVQIYGHTYNPHVFMNGDLLCITLNK